MKYYGNRLVNLNNIFFCIFIFPFLIYNTIEHEDLYFLLLIFPIMFLIFFIETSYFAIEDEFFIVSFYILPFLKIRYKLNEIKSIRISNPYRSFSKAQLQIKKDNKKSIAYRSASMRNKDWRLLIDDLKNLNISLEEDSLNLRIEEKKTYKQIQDAKKKIKLNS